MAIATGISDNLTLPLAHFCIDDTAAAEERDCCAAWFGAPMLATGTGNPDQKYLIANADQAEELFGTASVAAEMAAYYFANNEFGELYITGLENTGLKASATFTVQNLPTASGTIYLRIGDVAYYVGVLPTDTAINIVTHIVAEINEDTDAPFTASSIGPVVTIQAKQGGPQGNGISITTNALPGETDPPGFTYTITPFAGGNDVYDLDTALANLGDCCYDFMAIPFCEPDNLATINTEVEQRWSCDRLIGGRWYAICCDTFTNHITRLQSLNYRHGSLITCCPEDLAIPWRKLAAFVGAAHASTCEDPRAAWYGLELQGIRCSVTDCEEECFTRNERNLLVLNGGTTTKCGDAGLEIIEVESSIGAKSLNDVWRFPQTAYQTLRFVRDLASFVNSEFANVSIVESLENVPDGSSVVTLGVIVAKIKAWATITQSEFIDNAGELDNFITIDRNANNPFRVDMCINVDLVNALRIFAIKVRPRLRIL